MSRTARPAPVRPAPIPDRDELMGPSRTPSLGVLWFAVAAFGLTLAAANVLFGNLNHDEGWYLLAALRVAHGQVPYRDFLFTQGPVMPVVYGALSPLWAPQGVLGGRVVTALFGLCAAALAALLASRLTSVSRRSQTAFAAWLLTACVPVHSYFSAIPKTYALASLLLVGGFLLLTRAGAWAAGLAGALLGLAAATRISLGLALPMAFIALWLFRRDPIWRGAWLAFAVGGALALLLTYGVCLLWYGDQFLFAQSYHATREGGGLGAWLALRAGFASRTLQGWPLPCLLACGVLLTRRRPIAVGAAPDEAVPSSPAFGAAVATVLAVTLLHGVSPFPYEDYQTPVMPLLAAVVAVELWRRLGVRERTSVPLLLFVAAGLLAVASPLLMDWAVIRKDRFWFERKGRPDVLVLRDVGRWVRERVPEGGLLLTQDAYLAVEAGRDVPAGLEMGPFSLFPGLSDETARLRHVHTPATLAREIGRSSAPVVATSGYSFALACPGTTPLPEADRAALFAALKQNYEPVREIPNFGQAHTALTLWQRRPTSAAAGGSER